MLVTRRRGRPPRPLAPTVTGVTLRLRRLVDLVHDGNLLEAAAHCGVAYGTLREIHTGRTRNPGLATLERISRAYGVPMEWFLSTAEKDDGSVPFVGWVGFLPADAESGAGWQYARRVTVPYAAWPLVQLLLRLESRLRELPTHPDRPIIGAATDPRECKRRLAGFILQPLLAAHALGAKDVLQADPPLPGQSPLEGSAREEWLETLRHLGLFWDRALAGMVAE